MIFVVGEIDCREGIFLAIEKCVYDNVEEGVRSTVRIFIDVIKELVEKRNLRVFIHPIMPVLDETREMVKLYNSIYRAEVDKIPFVTWLDFFDHLLTPDGLSLRSEYKLDGTHASPKYTTLIESAITVLD